MHVAAVDLYTSALSMQLHGMATCQQVLGEQRELAAGVQRRPQRRRRICACCRCIRQLPPDRQQLLLCVWGILIFARWRASKPGAGLGEE